MGTTATPTAPAPPPTSEVSAEAFASIAKLQQLALEAGLSDDLRQLVFRILNRSIIYCRYDRAVLWDLHGKRPKLLGVSGNTDIQSHSPLADEWRSLVAAMANPDRSAILEGEAFVGRAEAWDALAQRTKGLSAAWLPIKVGDRTVAGWWLERWAGVEFSRHELTRLEPLALAYGVAWRSVARSRRTSVREFLSRRGVVVGAAVLVMAALCLVRVPLRIVAPCEVVARNPVAVTASLNGVIDEVTVLPGRSVIRGQLLALYDKRVASEELEVARKQVQIVESDLQRSRVQAFDQPAERAAISLLENRLQQEQIRLQLAQQRFEQLEIIAPADGVLMFGDPQQWRGRPVQVGERMMMIVEPECTKLRVWLPDSDNIDFDWDQPVKVILDSDPGASHSARLQFLSNCSETNTDGRPRFRAEADWVRDGGNVRMGLQGTAVLYGRRVSLGYWLLRRPLGATRGFLGI